MKKYIITISIFLLVFWADISDYISSKYPKFEKHLISYLFRLIKDIPIILFLTIITYVVYQYMIKNSFIRLRVMESEEMIKKHLGKLQNIGVAGIVNSDKTSTWAFGVNVLERLKIDTMIDKINYIKNKCYFIDYNLIDNYIFDNLDIYKSMSDRDYRLLSSAALQHFGYTKSYLQPVLIKTAFKYVSIINFIAEYIELFYILNIRPSNVVSNVAVYSENTGSFPFVIKENYFTMYKDMDFKLEKYMLVLDDEKGVFDNYKSSMKRDAKSLDDNDDGKSEFSMLFRHPFKGTTTRIGIQQNLSDFVANQRRQYQAVMNMDSHEDFVPYEFEKSIINRLIMFFTEQEFKYYNKKLKYFNTIKKPCKKYFKLAFKLRGYLDRKNNFKFIKSILFNLLDFLENKEIRIERVSLYFNTEDIGKDLYRDDPNTKSLAFPLVLFVPKNRSWSYYDTHSYSSLFKKLKDNTKGSILTTKRFKSTTVTADEFDSMNYKVYNKMLDKIENKNNDLKEKKDKQKDENNSGGGFSYVYGKK